MTTSEKGQKRSNTTICKNGQVKKKTKRFTCPSTYWTGRGQTKEQEPLLSNEATCTFLQVFRKTVAPEEKCSQHLQVDYGKEISCGDHQPESHHCVTI